MDAIGSTELPHQELRRLTHPYWLVLLFAVAAMLRLSAPNDFFEGDQNKQVGYVMDLLHHGHWATQFEVNGLIATKPPLYNWMAAGFCRAVGSTAPWVIKLPSLLAAGLLLVLLYRLTAHFLGQPAAFFACMACIASHHFTKLMWFARTDMLMTATVYAAIYVLVAVKDVWWKSSVLGIIMAASVLAKGPVGPCLFGIFLVLWAVREGHRPSMAKLRVALPGLIIFSIATATWLLIVMRLPEFRESVLNNELARRLPGSSVKTQPFYYYISHLFTRIAPWSLIGVLTAIAAYRRQENWTQIRFLVIWAAAYFVFFSAIPSKRHDLLLPVYPVMFMLAGLALEQMAVLLARRERAWFPMAAGAVLAIGGLVVSFRADGKLAITIAVATAVAGGLTIAAIRWRRDLALPVMALAFLGAHGLYYHYANVGPRVDYQEFATFVRDVKTETAGQPVLVYHSHPLISYELDLHEEFPDPRDLLERRPQWLIAPAPEVPIIESWTRWKLTPERSFSFHGLREIDATLYRVESTPLVTAAEAEDSITHR
ncbi:ArnT family glycosyltransferase [Symmachiella dynata]|uniref:ArnT family glycosyltransferase n=1 Tax=Symmachiella dynata TaxID=2527995 RepID=UPI0030ECC356